MRAAVPLNLLPEMLKALGWQALAPLRSGIRRNWFYRRLLRGPLADHIAFHPQDFQPRRLEDADALLRGRFRFAGESVDVPEGRSVFDIAPPSAASGETWPMERPEVPPEKRPSVMRAQSFPSPFDFR